MIIFIAIHYWIGDYFTNVLEIKDKLVRTSSYSFISLAGTFFGSTVGEQFAIFLEGMKRKVPFLFVYFIFNFDWSSSNFTNCYMPILIGISFSYNKRIKTFILWSKLLYAHFLEIY